MPGRVHEVSTQRLVVGLVRGLHGVQGRVRVEVLTDSPEQRFAPGAVVYPEGSADRLTIVEGRPVPDGPGWWLRFAELPSRDHVESLRDTYLEADVPLDEREPGRWHFHELEGLAVRSRDGRDLGRVREIYRAGAAEVFVVRGPGGELDVPAVSAVVVEVAPERGEIVIDTDALDLDARPVDEPGYVRPRDRRPAPRRPKSRRPRSAPPPSTPPPAASR
ncbi:MAG TPA: ribosome maturation factor RimM [Candidatus Limnocylindrales bacterium]|nr:ribosome maturation factor RimM [Candidatus Limnocylindrales bacterium]